MEQKFEYFAFISYNSKDQKWGMRVQKKLEHYRMPTTLCNKYGWKRTPLRPVFFAPTDIQPGGLTEELKERLRKSRNLIVICSPNSARSKWVGTEIEYFHQLGRTKHIYFFIVDGVPHSGNEDTECYNPIVKELGLPEILGVNIHEKVYRWPWLNKERAYVQLITKLLGVEYDSVWQRHKRSLIGQVVAWVIGCIAVVAALIGVWIGNQPMDVKVSLQEKSIHNSLLPSMKDAVVSITLGEEKKTDTVATLNDVAEFLQVPSQYLDKDVRVTFQCNDYLPVDTIMKLTKNCVINVYRDASVYGDVCFQLWDINKGRYVSDCGVTVDGFSARSDSQGRVSMKIPLDRQKQKYHITAERPLEDSTLAMPYGKNCAIRTK